MEKTFIKRRLFACIAAILAAVSSFAQTITTGAVSPAAVCAGNSISVPFTTTGTFVAGNVFTIELSTAAGAFPGTVLATTGTATPLSAVVPAATLTGASYTVRVTSSSPAAATMTPSAAFTVNAIPVNPTFTAPPSYVTGATAAQLTASGSNLLWYSAATGGTGSATAPTPTTTAAGTQSFYVSQTVGSCESGRAQIDVVVTACTPPPAPTVAPVAYTVGQTPVALTATGTGLLWYSAATGGTGSTTAPTPTTTAAGTQNFWVTQTVSACESSRSQITVTVTACTPPTAPTVAPVAYTVGQTPVVLTATGTGLLWYSAATGGTGSTTAPIPTTTAAGTQNFWVTQTVSACESPRANIVVTVTACTPPAAPTVAPVAYTVGQTPVVLTATGTGLLWYSAATGGTGSTTAPTPTTTAAGTQNFWVTQTVSACESPRSQITVTVSACTPPPAPTVANLSYTVGQTPVALTATGTGLLWYSAATGGTGSTTAPIPTTTAAGVQNFWVSQTVSACESSRSQITVTVSACTPPPAPTVANVSYTVGQAPVALTATGTGLLWYAAATGGTGSATAPTPTTTAAGTQNFWVTQTISACESSRSQITVTVSACVPPPNPTVANKNYMVGDVAVALTATGSAGATFKWYSSLSSTTPLTTVPVPSTTVAGITNYYVTQTVNGCESNKAEIVVTVSNCIQPPNPTVANKSYTVGDAAVALTATGSAGATFKWYSSASSTTALTTVPVPVTAVAGIFYFYVTQTVNNCESNKAEIIVTVSACALSAEPTVTSATTFCATTAPIPALTATGTAIKWYNASGGLIASAVPNGNVSVSEVQTFYVTQTEAGKCESAKKAVEIIINKTPLPVVSSTVVEYCLNSTATALTATGTALKWYPSTTGTTEISPIPVTKTAGNLVFYVSQSLYGCEGDRARIDVKIKTLPAVPTVTTLAAVCENTTVASTVLSGAVTPQTGLLWYTVATGGIGTSSVPAIVTTTAGIKNYYVTQTADGCESETRAILALDVKAQPAAPTVAAVPYCKDVTNATALTATGTGLKWYNGLTGGTALTAAPVPSTATVGTASYYVSQTTAYTGLSCEGPRAKLDVVTNPLPSSLTDFSTSVCQDLGDNNYTFLATPSSGNTIVWYNAATGTATAIPTVSLKTAGETTFYAVQKTTSTGCESPVRAANKIRVKVLPAAPSVSSALVEYCQFVAATPLSATPLSGATLDWYGTNASGGTASGNAPTPQTANANPATTSYYVGQTLEGCQGGRTKIDVKINTTPLPATQTLLAYCQNETAPILDATGTVLKWYRTADGGPNDWQGYPFTPYTGKVEDYSFFVTQTGLENKCESPKQEIRIHIKALPSATLTGNTTIDLGQSANLSLAFTGDGPWKYILSHGVTNTTTQSTVTERVTPLTTTTYFVTEISNSCGKGSPVGTVLISVRIPTITSGSPSVAEACAGKSFTVPFQQSGDYPAGNTFKVQISLTNDDTKFYTIPSVATSNLITATFPDTTAGGNYFVRVVSSGTNPAFLVRGSVSPLGITASPLPVATISGAQTVLMGDPATLKVDITGKSPWTFSLNNGVKDSLITATTASYTFKMTPRATTTYTITSATNGCGIGKGAGSARVQVDPILAVEPVVTDWVTVYPTIAETLCTIEISGPVSPKDAKVQVIDLTGRQVFEQVIRQKTTELDFSKYPSGLYLLRVQNGNLRSVNKVMKR